MSISVVFLGGYSKPMMAAVYFSLCVPIAWRSILRRNLSPLTVGGGALSSSLIAFGLSNFAVWYAWYPQTIEGLTSCYVRAIPFLANAMKSDLLFAAGFFGLYAVVTHLSSQPTRSLSAEAA
jgi:hypothetical protein